MSIEVLLIPLGIAAYGAVATWAKESRSIDLCEKCKATRVMQMPLLIEALAAIGITVTTQSADRLTGTGKWGAVTFQKVGDLFLGRADGDENATKSMLGELDAEVGHIAQVKTASLVVERAQQLGFRMVEQYEDDGSLNYVFEELE
ncbi:hypothetical protein [uncultured Microbacterium sp.]|uniref:hypothetical protein n=1 Tax=uncultured Microbacterium sp. TaxID=191216 RepID=UPI0026261B5D|nr:hypothetical protein [uncultured Microbacterium sp.]